ncbi:MAG TPA: hypothetical protein VHF51_11790 [Solirubrobacteraceae bacterium]|nr:hypothetical protein [Solirubrobacteraceae bacterium]
MGEVLLATLGPTAVFGLFALLCMRFGAESRPYFDEKPVVDDRPNWFPIAGASGMDDEDDGDDAIGPPEAEPAAPRAAPRQPRAAPVPAPVASARSAATSPSGV